MNSSPTSENCAFAAEVYHRLLAAYGEPTWRPYYQPMDELVLTFLSQNTSDLNSGRAFEALKARHPAWQAVLDAPVAEPAETIRSGGLAQQKAPRIERALRRILAERGEFSLDFLADLPVDEATRRLTSFDGIGHKTASIVPSSASTSRRSRWTRTWAASRGGGAGRAEGFRGEDQGDLGEALAPAEWFYPLHLNLIRHGREVCHAERPACVACALADICRYPQKP